LATIFAYEVYNAATILWKGNVFGFVTHKANRLKITGIGKGTGEGILRSIIIIVILYITTAISMVQPNLLKIMDQVNPKQNSVQDQLMVE